MSTAIAVALIIGFVAGILVTVFASALVTGGEGADCERVPKCPKKRVRGWGA